MTNSNSENLNLTNDLLFQRVFGRIGNENITKGFLEKILGYPIESLTLNTNKRLIGTENDDKRSRLDVKAVLNDGTKVIIEMQVKYYNFIPKRFLFYCSRVFEEGFKKNSTYDDLDKTIGVFLLKEGMPITKSINKCHTVWHFREDNERELVLTPELEIHIIELDKFDDTQTDLPEYDWLKFIKEGENMGEPVNADEALKEAREELERLLSDPALEEQYEDRIDYYRMQISIANEERAERT